MRTSQKRTTVAVLRGISGRSTREFARDTGLSLSTVEKLESGQLRLSATNARKLSFETRVSFRWLLGGNTEIPALLEFTTPEFEAGQEDLDVATGNADAPLYTVDVYNRARAARLSGQSPVPDGHHTFDEQLECVLFRFFAAYCAARGKGEQAMLLHELDAMEAELVRKFGFTLDRDTLAFASKAIGEMQKLTARLKRVRLKEGDLACTPKSANFFTLMRLRRRTAKTMRRVTSPAGKCIGARTSH
jgi:transcriptional regulator with XRE-family HTH domain